MPNKPKFATADDLIAAAEGYFKWCDENPIRGARSVRGDGKKDGKKVTEDEMLPRPYTFEGLCLHVGIPDWTMFVTRNKEREGFEDAIGYIRNKIRRCQIEGGMVGIYRENLTARLNGIAEQVQDVTPPPSTIEIRVEE